MKTEVKILLLGLAEGVLYGLAAVGVLFMFFGFGYCMGGL